MSQVYHLLRLMSLLTFGKTGGLLLFFPGIKPISFFILSTTHLLKIAMTTSTNI